MKNKINIFENKITHSKAIICDFIEKYEIKSVVLYFLSGIKKGHEISISLLNFSQEYLPY